MSQGNEERNDCSEDFKATGVRHATLQSVMSLQSAGHCVLMPKRHDDQTLFNALEHIAYEIQMYVDLSAFSIVGCNALSNAVFESWLIHLRTLNEFLSPAVKKRTCPDDVRPEHFDIELSVPFLSVILKKRLDKEMAHITYKRHSDTIAKQWNKAEIFKHTWPILRDVIGQLIRWVEKHENQSQWVAECIELQRRGDEVFAIFSGLPDNDY